MMSAAGSAVAPSIIRHLQSLGHYVIGHDCCEYGYGASVCDKFYQSYRVDDPYYRAFLIDHLDTCGVYLPFMDEELLLLSDVAGHQTIKPVRSPYDTLRTFTDKRAQHDAMHQAGLPAPPFIAANFIGLPLIAKPRHGRGGKGVMRLDDGSIGLSLLQSGNYHVERFIDGDEYTVDVLTGMDGAFLFAVPRLRIQANGVSVVGKIVMDAEIIDLARLVVSKFAFRGPINIQIIRERATSKLYIIELNPRLSGSCIFTVMAGFDILDATIRLWEGKPFVAPDKIEDGLVIRRHYVEERLT